MVYEGETASIGMKDKQTDGAKSFKKFRPVEGTDIERSSRSLR